MKKTQKIGLDELEIKDNKMFVRKNVDEMDVSAQVIVEDTHSAILIKDGKMQETLSAGAYPLFDKKRGLFKDYKVGSFTVSLIYMSKTAEMKGRWGTPTPFDFRDPIVDLPITIGASGEYGVRIYDPRQFYLTYIGANKDCTVEDFAARVRERLISIIKPAIAKQITEKKLSYYDLVNSTEDIANAVLPVLQEMFRKEYGLDITYFIISSIVIKPEDKRKIEEALQKVRDKKEAEEELRRQKEDYKWWVAEYERLEDRKFEREKLMRELEARDYEKYLEVCKIVGWKGSADTKNGGMFCTNCGAPYTAGDKFCGKCGHKVGDWKVTCPKCGHENPSGNTFCSSCGQKL